MNGKVGLATLSLLVLLCMDATSRAGYRDDAVACLSLLATMPADQAPAPPPAPVGAVRMYYTVAPPPLVRWAPPPPPPPRWVAPVGISGFAPSYPMRCVGGRCR